MAADTAKLFEHVKDAHAFHLPFHNTLGLPEFFGFQITKFMVLEVVAALIIIAIYVWPGRIGRRA